MIVDFEWGTKEKDPHDYNAPIWSFDIESSSLEYKDPSFQIYMLGIHDGTRTVIYRGVDVKVGFRRLHHAAQETDVRVFGHNSIEFDAVALQQVFGLYVTTDDTMILAHKINEEEPSLALEALCVAKLNIPPWKQQVTWDWANMTDDDFQLCAQYNAEDVVNTYHLAVQLVKEASELGLGSVYDITRRAAQAFDHRVSQLGIALDLHRLHALRDTLRVDAMDAQLRFEQIIGHPVNLNSPKQIAKALFVELGLSPVRYTKTKQPSTDALSIKTLLLGQSNSEAFEALNCLLKAKGNAKLEGMLQSYAEKCVNGRLYVNYFTHRTTTGRSTADKGFQQFPHDKRVRSLLTTEPGNALIEADYSQLQMRLAADISGSPAMREIFRQGIDPHRFMASKITGKPMDEVSGEERYVAKPVNFGLLFAGDTHTLRKQALLDYDIVLSEGEARRIYNIFHDTYQLEPWYDRVVAELKLNQMVRDPLGGIRHLPDIASSNPYLQLEAIRQAINYPVQAFEVYIAFCALWECYRVGLRVVAFFHDALFLECPIQNVDTVSEKLREIMTVVVPKMLEERYGYRLSVPLEIDLKVTYPSLWEQKEAA